MSISSLMIVCNSKFIATQIRYNMTYFTIYNIDSCIFMPTFPIKNVPKFCAKARVPSRQNYLPVGYITGERRPKEQEFMVDLGLIWKRRYRKTKPGSSSATPLPRGPDRLRFRLTGGSFTMIFQSGKLLSSQCVRESYSRCCAICRKVHCASLVTDLWNWVSCVCSDGFSSYWWVLLKKAVVFIVTQNSYFLNYLK